MPRKTGNTTTPRNKKTTAATEPTVEQAAVAATPVILPVAQEIRKVTPINTAFAKPSLSLEEEIRVRAYELYLQRNGADGDPNVDWLIAEREVRSRHADHRKQSA